ncbi:MAG: GNAT family N-acetyltransferase [Deltaproteobacteria bacterium]|nr:GNAT family N-acetyltransferase [Deltaproteobacteria bacterium]
MSDQISTRVRHAALSDLAAIHGLLVDLGYAHLSRDALADVLDALLRDDTRGVWLADVETEVVGLLTTTVRSQLRLAGLEMTVEELVVREHVRGRGVGRALLDRAKAEARRLGVLRVQLTTNRTRDVYVRGFYPKNGFVEAPSAVMRWSPET